MIKNIVFDLDGTLLNTRQVDNFVVKTMFEDYGVPKNITEKFYLLLGLNSAHNGSSSVFQRRKLWEIALDTDRGMQDRCYHWWEVARRNAVEIYFSLDWFLRDLSDEGFNIVVATSGDTYTQTMKLAWMNLDYPFFVFDKRANGFDKTDIVSWNTFFNLFDLGLDTFVVGDNFEDDIKIPHSLGRKTILAEWYNETHVFQSLIATGGIKSFDNCGKFLDYCISLKRQ